MYNVIDRNTFVDMESSEDKMNILFDLLNDTRNQYEEIINRLDDMVDVRQGDLHNIKEHCYSQKEECEKRFRKIEGPLHKIVGALMLLNAILLLLNGISFAFPF